MTSLQWILEGVLLVIWSTMHSAPGPTQNYSLVQPDLTSKFTIQEVSSWHHWWLQYHPWWSQWQVPAWSSSRWVLVMDQSDLAIKLAFKNRLMLKILAISANLNDILDELDTILDDPYARYLLRQSADFIFKIWILNGQFITKNVKNTRHTVQRNLATANL